MVAMATKQNYERCRTWSQPKAQQSMLLNSTISTTSWNCIFLGQDGFDVVVFEEKQVTKSFFINAKLILAKIQLIKFWSFSYAVVHELYFKMIPVTKNLTICKYPFCRREFEHVCQK